MSMYTINGHDMLTTYGAAITDKPTDPIKPPNRKASLQEDYADQDGIVIDLSLPTFEARTFELSIMIQAPDIATFKTFYNALMTVFSTAGTFALDCTAMGKTFDIYYSQTSNVVRYGNLNGGTITVVYTIEFIEPVPSVFL